MRCLVDDDSMRTALLRLLRASGLEAKAYASAGDFLLQRPADEPGCLLLDVLMRGPSGIDLQQSLNKRSFRQSVATRRRREDALTRFRVGDGRQDGSPPLRTLAPPLL
jgi:FixJ family two-component response regulator